MLQTSRLILVPMTASLIEAELAGSAAIARALQAAPPDTWPPGTARMLSTRRSERRG